MTEDRQAELCELWQIYYCAGFIQSVWLKYDGKTVQETGSRPMEIAG